MAPTTAQTSTSLNDRLNKLTVYGAEKEATHLRPFFLAIRAYQHQAAQSSRRALSSQTQSSWREPLARVWHGRPSIIDSPLDLHGNQSRQVRRFISLRRRFPEKV